MTERQLAAFTADHEQKVQFDTQPRSLAGPGDPRHVTHPLLAAGWKNTSDPSLPQVHLISPDQLATLTVDSKPDRYPHWWRIGSPLSGFGFPYWSMTFGGLTPPEILAGVTDALIRSVPDQESAVGQILADAGWMDVPAEGAPGTAVSPDQMVRVERLEEGGEAYAWRVEVAWHHRAGNVDHIWPPG